MQIWSPNSRRCSKAEAGARHALAVAALVCGAIAVASSPGEAAVKKGAKIVTPLQTTLKSDLATRKTTVFDNLLKRWDRQYGTRAVEPLLAIAADTTSPDADRYVALMGAARLGGYSAAPLFTAFLKDSSWMIRAAALRILAALENPATSQAVLPLLQDKALVVRLEAVTAVEQLRPVGAVAALVDSLASESNYHGGKALWVPHKVLDALVSLGASDASPKLRPLLERQTDPDLMKKLVNSLDALAGQPPEAELPVHERVNRWKVALGPLPPATNTDAISSGLAAPSRAPARAPARSAARAPASAAAQPPSAEPRAVSKETTK
jgi:hypothetical protein